MVVVTRCSTLYGRTNKLPRLGVEDGQVYEETKIVSKASTWYWNTKGMSPFNTSKNSPFNTFAKNVKYGAW